MAVNLVQEETRHGSGTQKVVGSINGISSCKNWVRIGGKDLWLRFQEPQAARVDSKLDGQITLT